MEPRDESSKVRTNLYVKIDGVDGPVESAGYEKTHPAVTAEVSMAGVGHVPGKEAAARRETKPFLGDLRVATFGSHNIHEFFRRLHTGAVIKQVVVTRPAMDGGGRKDHVETYDNVVLTAIRKKIDSDGNCLLDLTFEYGTWGLECFKPDGSSAGAAKYDIPKATAS